MNRILVRAHKDPFTVADAPTTLGRNLIGDNVGNLVFSQAVCRLLSTEGNDLTMTRVGRLSPRKINRSYDRLVIPLANAFRPSFVESLDELSTLIEGLTIPVVVLGVGAQASLTGVHRAADEVATATRRFVSAVLDRSPSIGVRGEYTQAYLRGLGFGDDHVEVIGCPSMFSYGPELTVHRKVDELDADSPVALNISPYVLAMGPISTVNEERYPHLTYFAQDSKTLTLMLYGQYPELNPKAVAAGVPVTLEHPLIRANRVRFCLDPATWFAELGRHDFSFGTRIHGNIAALLAGTPALVLAHDSRTLELADYHHIPHRLITDLPPDADPAQLYAEADWEPLNANHAARWETFAAFLARHGLDHGYLPGNDRGAAFDARLAATDFPPPVETLMGLGPERLYELVRTVPRFARYALSGTSPTSGSPAGSAATGRPKPTLRSRVGQLRRKVRRR